MMPGVDNTATIAGLLHKAELLAQLQLASTQLGISTL